MNGICADQALVRVSLHKDNSILISLEGDSLVIELGSNNALKYGLAKCVVKNPSQKGDVPPNTLAWTVEAILGGVWLDSNKDIQKVEQVRKTLHLIK
jgi:hypothetical protein